MRPGAIALVIALSLAGLALGAALAWPRPPAPAAPVGTWDPADPELGAKAYVLCQACHGLDGRGVAGYAPALAGSRWLAGDARAAILIILHGFDATTEPGSVYVGSRMLGHGGQLTDTELAALLTWLRGRWGGTPVAAAEVAALRARFATRSAPWSPAELRSLAQAAP